MTGKYKYMAIALMVVVLSWGVARGALAHGKKRHQPSGTEEIEKAPDKPEIKAPEPNQANAPEPGPKPRAGDEAAGAETEDAHSMEKDEPKAPHSHGESEAHKPEASEESASHHAQETEQPGALARTIRFLGLFHPSVVHFPIALLMAAALAELLAMALKSLFFENAARFLVVIAALGAIPAVSLGWAGAAFEDFTGDYSSVLAYHQWLGTSVGALSVATAIISEIYRRRDRDGLIVLYRVLLFGCAVLAGMTGYFGGILVHGIGHYTW